MACYCVRWATGEPVCIGIIGDSTIARCRTECRLRGMGVLCFDSNGECNGDKCGNTGTKWWQLANCFASWDCSVPGHPECEYHVRDDHQVIYARCAIAQPPASVVIDYDWESRETWCNCTFRQVILGDGIWHHQLSDPPPGGPLRSWSYIYTQCTPSGTPLRTPCCYPDPTHPGITLCAFIAPGECLEHCGQFFEGTIGGWDTDPCVLTGDANPCNIRPCCRQHYPHPMDTDHMGGASEYGSSGKYCRNGTLANCANWDGTWNRDARSCYAPESCDRQFVDDLHCVRGDWVLTYRPSTTPPLMKRWIEGSAEIVSEKPERAMAPTGGPQDCTNHYGDVVYPFVEPGRSADAMGAICSTRASGVIDPGHTCRRYYEQDLCPVFYAPDGNARFRCEYRVA